MKHEGKTSFNYFAIVGSKLTKEKWNYPIKGKAPLMSLYPKVRSHGHTIENEILLFCPHPELPIILKSQETRTLSKTQ